MRLREWCPQCSQCILQKAFQWPSFSTTVLSTLSCLYSIHDGCFNFLIDKQFLKHLKGHTQILHNFQGNEKSSEVRFKSKSWKECVPNQTRPTESVIPIKKENKQVKVSDLLWGKYQRENLREPRSCEKTIGSHSGNRAKLFCRKNTAFGPRMMTMGMRMMGIWMGKAVNGGLEEEVKPYSNFISRMSCLPQLRLIIQLHTNPSHSPKISQFVSGNTLVEIVSGFNLCFISECHPLTTNLRQ